MFLRGVKKRFHGNIGECRSASLLRTNRNLPCFSASAVAPLERGSGFRVQG